MSRLEPWTIDRDEWVLVTPFGPKRHAVTGESYQGMSARLEHEHQQRIRAGRSPVSLKESNVNHIPMRTGVKVKKEQDPRDGQVGTTIDRYENGDVLVVFADGIERRFAESELTTTL